MNGQWPATGPGSHPTPDHFASQQKLAGCPPFFRRRPIPGGQQRTVRYPDRGDAQYRPEMQSQSGPARVVESGGVDEQHGRGFTQCSQGGFEQWTLTKRQIATSIASSRPAGHGDSGNQVSVLHNASPCPTGVPAFSGSAALPLETHKHSTDAWRLRRDVPGVRHGSR